jgi:hypothetical protein
VQLFKGKSKLCCFFLLIILIFRNHKVQLKAVNLGFIQYILRLLNIELDDNIIFRLLYTLSTLLRNFPQAQKNFLEHGGAELMVKILDRNNKIAVRAITLMNDLIIEKVKFKKIIFQIFLIFII